MLELQVHLKSSNHLEAIFIMPSETWTIGRVAERAGVATSALRFYEEQGLIEAERTSSGHRRYSRDVLRRIAFLRIAQRVGLSLDEVRAALEALPDARTPTKRDWQRLAESWGPRLDEHIRMLERLRNRLDGCIGCGCLSMRDCALLNPDDEVAVRGPGPRHVLAGVADS